MGPSLLVRLVVVLAASAIVIAMTASALVWLVRLPSDALTAGLDAGSAQRGSRYGRVVRSLAGITLVLLGFILALPGVPGPGILLALLGLVVADLPGKRRAELHLLRQGWLLDAVNALRRRFHRGPLEVPGRGDAS